MNRFGASIAASLLTFCLYAPVAQEANGSVINGWGTSARGYAGAGVALAEDAMTIANNPAGLVGLKGRGIQLGATLIKTKQTFEAGEFPPPAGPLPPGAMPLTPGTRYSDPDVPAEIGGVFPVPFAAAHWRLSPRHAVGLAVYGNGGININYKDFDNPNCPPGSTGRGILCSGETGSDIAQAFIAPAYAYQPNRWLRLGITPLLVIQSFEIRGLGAFAPLSSDPDKLTNNGHDIALGYGVKAGLQAQLLDSLALGITLQSRIEIEEHDKYAGLIAEQGDLDGAPYFQMGLAWDATQRLTLLADVQRHYFSKVRGYANEGVSTGRYGDDDGPGFGWRDVPAYKIGLRYRASDRWVFRASYADNEYPVTPDNALANFLSNAVFEEHYALGLTSSPGPRNSFDVTVNYNPPQRNFGPNPFYPQQTIQQTNRIYTLDLAWTRHF